jgi:hypothetical protein
LSAKECLIRQPWDLLVWPESMHRPKSNVSNKYVQIHFSLMDHKSSLMFLVGNANKIGGFAPENGHDYNDCG